MSHTGNARRFTRRDFLYLSGISASGLAAALRGAGPVAAFQPESPQGKLAASYNWTAALTPADTTSWAAQLHGRNGLRRVRLRDIDFNRAGTKLTDNSVASYGLTTHGAQAFRWNEGDQLAEEWFPQGICGIRLKNPRLSMVVASWHHTKDPETGIDKGVRLSFANVTPDDPRRYKYRHVLLVERDGSSGFKPVRIHAGGIGYSAGYLFVADTSRGIRVFDTSLLMTGLKADPNKDRCGFVGGAAYAFDYRYIIPQVYSYRGLYQALIDSGLAESSGNAPKFSYLSMDWSASVPRILTGSYMNTNAVNSGKYPTAFLWQLSAQSPGRLDTNSVPRNLNIPIGYNRFRWIQGAAIAGSNLYLSRSAGQGIKRHTLSGTWQSNNYSVDLAQQAIAPPTGNSTLGFEDLHLSKNSDILWGLSEHVGHRIVFWLQGVK